MNEVATWTVVTKLGPYGRDVQAGPIYRKDGSLMLVALRDVPLGDTRAQDAFVYPDFSRPQVGEVSEAGEFWGGYVEFYQ